MKIILRHHKHVAAPPEDRFLFIPNGLGFVLAAAVWVSGIAHDVYRRLCAENWPERQLNQPGDNFSGRKKAALAVYRRTPFCRRGILTSSLGNAVRNRGYGDFAGRLLATTAAALLAFASAGCTGQEAGNASPPQAETAVSIAQPESSQNPLDNLPAGQPTFPPTPTETPAPTETPQIIEPSLPPRTVGAEVLPSHPPSFNRESANLPPTGPFNLADAHAVYALYREAEGPLSSPDPDSFIQAMDAYRAAQPDLTLLRAGQADATYALLTRHTDQGQEVLLGFTPDGKLADNRLGAWGPEITQVWVPTGAATAAELDLFVGPDGLAYLARLDGDSREVNAYLDLAAAPFDTLNLPWIPVAHGWSQMHYIDGQLIPASHRLDAEGNPVPLMTIGERRRLMVWDDAKKEYQPYQIEVKSGAESRLEPLSGVDRIDITDIGLFAFDLSGELLLVVDFDGTTYLPDQLGALYRSLVPELVWNGSEYAPFPPLTPEMYQSLRLDPKDPEAIPMYLQDNWSYVDRHGRTVYTLESGGWQPVEPVYTTIGSNRIDVLDLQQSGYTVTEAGIFKSGRLIIDLSSGTADFPLPILSGSRVSYQDVATARQELSVSGGDIFTLDDHVEIRTPDYRYVFNNRGEFTLITPSSLTYRGVTIAFDGFLADPRGIAAHGGAIGLNALYWAEARSRGLAGPEEVLAEVTFKKFWDGWAAQQGWQQVPDWAGRTTAPSFDEWFALVSQAYQLQQSGDTAGAETIIAQTGVRLWGVDNRHEVGHVYPDGSVKTYKHYEEPLFLHPLDGILFASFNDTQTRQTIIDQFANPLSLTLGYDSDIGGGRAASSLWGYALDQAGRVVLTGEVLADYGRIDYAGQVGFPLLYLSKAGYHTPRIGLPNNVTLILFLPHAQERMYFWGTHTDEIPDWIIDKFYGAALTGYSYTRSHRGTFLPVIKSAKNDFFR